MAPDRWTAKTEARARAILEHGWGWGRLPRLRVDSDIDWAAIDERSRSWAFHVHSFDPIATLLCAYDHGAEPFYLQAATAFTTGWVRANPEPEASQSGSAWYDMATGLRVYRLAYLLDCLLRLSEQAEVVAPVVDSLRVHLQVLEDDDFIAGHSNHGLYQAAGQLAASRRLPDLPGADKAFAKASDRLERIVATHFTDEGVHREHSPQYHWFVLQALSGLVAAGLLAQGEMLRRYEQIQEAFAWFVKPDGHVVAFGDSDHISVFGEHLSTAMVDQLTYVTTAGRDGLPPTSGAHTFRDSGYFMVREPDESQAFEASSYLAFNCAFHSRTHKHADDLSFILHDRGQELLVDAGRYGYEGRTTTGSDLWQQGFWYSDPNRIYVESTKAHNTVEIDGRSHPRRTPPYGSALEAVQDVAPPYAVWARVRHGRAKVLHDRILVYQPGSWLVVVDDLSDPSREPHTYRQRFHFAPERDVMLIGETLRVGLTEDEVMWVFPLVTNSEPFMAVRGQQSPDLLGWISRDPGSMIPCWSAWLEQRGACNARFATAFVFGSEGASPQVDEAACFSTQAAELSWSLAEGATSISLSWGARRVTTTGKRSESSLSCTVRSAERHPRSPPA